MNQLHADKTSLQDQIHAQTDNRNTLQSQVNQLQTDNTNLQNQIKSLNETITDDQEYRQFLRDQIDYFTKAAQALLQFVQNSQVTPENIRDFTMYYISVTHKETSWRMWNVAWTGGRTTPSNIVGEETYPYTSNGWNGTMNYPVVPNPTYNIKVYYNQPSSDLMTIW